MPILPVVKNEKNNFTVVTVHYSADPEKDKQWVKEAKKGVTDRAWNREYEIDYTYFSGKPFFPEFNQFNIAKVKYQRGETLYRGWDYGFHRPCCFISKLNEFDQWGWMKIILGQDEGILDFGKRVVQYCLGEYPGAKYIDADDIAGQQVSDKSELTSRQILNQMGVYPQARKQEIDEGAEIIRQKLAIRVDGKPGLIVDPSQVDVIDGFRGGIHYPDVYEEDGITLKSGKREPRHYEKDGYYDHIFDSARYISIQMFTIIGQSKIPDNLTKSEGSGIYFPKSGERTNSLISPESGQGMGDFF